MVGTPGLEPGSLTAADFKSAVFTSFTMLPISFNGITKFYAFANLMLTYFENLKASRALFFLPIYDDNKPEAWPLVTWLLLAACVVVFFIQMSANPIDARLLMLQYATIPALVSGESTLPADFAVIPPAASLITSVFMHGGWLHLGGNMLYLWIFGDNVEDKMGPYALRCSTFFAVPPHRSPM